MELALGRLVLWPGEDCKMWGLGPLTLEHRRTMLELSKPNWTKICRVSRYIEIYRDISRCIEMYRDISRCIEMYRDVSNIGDPHFFQHIVHHASWLWPAVAGTAAPAWPEPHQAELQRIRDEATELKAGATTDDFWKFSTTHFSAVNGLNGAMRFSKILLKES